MNPTGHYGINLTLGGGCLLGLTLLNRPLVGVVAFAAIASVSQLPDIDHHAYNVPLIKHRGWTHTLYFASGLGIGTALAGFKLAQYFAPRAPIAPPSLLPLNYIALLILVFSIGTTVGILGHIAGDMLTPAGIAPFNPILPRISISTLPEESWTLDLTTAANPTANGLFGLLGATVTAAALYVAVPEIIGLI